MATRTTSGNERTPVPTPTVGPEQLRIHTLLAVGDAFAAQLKVTAKWRAGTVRALLNPGTMPSQARVDHLLRPIGGGR